MWTYWCGLSCPRELGWVQVPPMLFAWRQPCWRRAEPSPALWRRESPQPGNAVGKPPCFGCTAPGSSAFCASVFPFTCTNSGTGTSLGLSGWLLGCGHSSGTLSAWLLSLPLLSLPSVASSRGMPCPRAPSCELHVYNSLLPIKATECKDFVKLAPFPLSSVRYTYLKKKKKLYLAKKIKHTL